MVIYRSCNPDNLAECANLFIDIYSEEPYNEIWNEERSLKYLSRFFHFDRKSCMVAVDDGTIVGAIFGYVYPWNKNSSFFIQELFVKPEYRRRKIAQHLITAVLKEIREPSNVVLIAKEKSDAALFYESQGISQNKEYRFFSGKFKP